MPYLPISSDDPAALLRLANAAVGIALREFDALIDQMLALRDALIRADIASASGIGSGGSPQ